ncbi:MAG: HPr kinase/phosphatase C-terminal domain-containing protein [Rhizobiaceae bacterium]|nr:HPr kinase/phosphatase C-terminal domain-containing protein [Rhizobiaceae bacterium]
MMSNNLHGTAIIVADHGIFIRGDSGTGKTALALELLSRAFNAGLYARLVADDQLFAAQHDGRLVLTAPDPIAGLVEIRGHGPSPIAYQRQAVIDLVVTLVAPAQAERLPDPAFATVCAVKVPELRLAAKSTVNAASACAAWVGIGLFDAVHMRQNG